MMKNVRVEAVDKIWLSQKEVAKYIGMSQSYVAELRRKGLLRHSMIGNASFFKKDDVDKLLERHRVY